MGGEDVRDSSSRSGGLPGLDAGAPDRPVLLEVRGLSRRFRLPRTALLARRRWLHAVRGVDLDLYAGERLGIVGESGSGKSTLARLLMALDTPQHGSIVFDGRDLAGLRERELAAFRRRCQIVFQDPLGSLDPRMKVRTLVTEPLRALRVPEDHDARMYELLEAVGLSRDAADRYPHQFSGGQRQRIAIARALAPRPKILIADELVSALDVSVRAQILNLLLDLGETFDFTLLLISHDLSVVYRVCDRVAVMYLGAVVEYGPTHEVFARPAHPYTQALLRAIPTLSGGLPEAPAGQGPPSAADLPPGCAYQARCPLVHERCRTEEPALRGEVGAFARGDGRAHEAACHLAFTPDMDSHRERHAE